MRDANATLHIEVDHYNIPKHGQQVSGDSFVSQRVSGENRVVSVLADGLGSGIKASVLSTLTTSMALKFSTSTMNITHAAERILQTLPVCSVRKIAYSTFMLVDMHPDGATRFIEYSTPPYFIIRNGRTRALPKTTIALNTPNKNESSLCYSSYRAAPGDRIVFCSDGVMQAGMGTPAYPLGWGAEGVAAFITTTLENDPSISARALARAIVRKAYFIDNYKAKDDITCASIYYRKPRSLLIVSGPPFHKEQDAYIAQKVREWKGETIICGGTTARIIARELHKELSIDCEELETDVPPAAVIPGINLVTEGNVTLSKIAHELQDEHSIYFKRECVLGTFLNALMDTDIIQFVIGTRINEAYQNPNFPQHFDIRKNIISNMATLLEKKYMKKVSIEYI